MNRKGGFEVQQIWLGRTIPLFQWEPSELSTSFNIFKQLGFQIKKKYALAGNYLIC